MTSGDPDAKLVATHGGKVGSASAGSSVPAWCARVVTCATGLAEGYDIGSISGVAVLLRQEMGLTKQQVGLVIGVMNYAMIVGAPLGGWYADAAGRKKALGATYVFLIAGSMIMTFATRLEHLLLGRVALGLAIGAGFSVVTAYITEVSPKSHRGTMVGLEDLFLVMGISLGYAFNYLLAGISNDWRWMVGIGAIPPALALALLLFPQVLESPRWHMLQGDRAEAERTLALLVGQEEAVKMLDEWGQAAPPCSWGEVIFPRGAWRQRSILAAISVTLMGILCGITTTTVYMGTILAGDLERSQVFLMSTLIGCLRVLILLFAVFVLIDSWGRKPLMIVSLSGMTFFMSLMSYAYLVEASAMPMKFSALLGFNLVYSAGLGPVSFVYAAEIVPTELRSKALSLGTMLARLTSGSMMMAFPLIEEQCGLHCIFTFFAMTNVIGLFVVLRFAPETRGTSLEEMHCLFDPAVVPAPGGETGRGQFWA